MNKQLYTYWLDKPVPYCCRDCVPAQFQHNNQLYELDMYGKVSKTFKHTCPNYEEK